MSLSEQSLTLNMEELNLASSLLYSCNFVGMG